MSSNELIGLRERKKDATRARVREAAIVVALREGCQHATVEVITREAEVAARTFFNYFESKEFALVGIEPRHFDAAAEKALAASARDPHAGTARQVVAYLVDVLWRAIESQPRPEGRREVLKQNPQLFEWQIRELDRAGAHLRSVVAVIVNGRSPVPVDDATVDQVLMTCLGAVAATGRAWLLENRPAASADFAREAAARVERASTLLTKADDLNNSCSIEGAYRRMRSSGEKTS